MKISDAHLVPFARERVWDALLDPRVLLATIPGCSRLEATGENAYAMTVTAGVAAIKGTYDGDCALRDLRPHDSLVMSLTGQGAPGTIDATVRVALAPETAEDGRAGTRIAYEADAVVGGMIGGVGQRMLSAVSRRMAREFFDNLALRIQAGVPAVPSAGPPAGPDQVAAAGRATDLDLAPARTAVALGGDQDFLRGVALGAGLVLAGVLVGRWTRR